MERALDPLCQLLGARQPFRARRKQRCSDSNNGSRDRGADGNPLW